MKKTVIFVLVLLLAATLPLTGCELLDQPFPEETDTDSSILMDPQKTQAVTDAPLTPEEEALVELAAEALWAKYDLPAREHFKVSIHPHASNGSNRVEFTLRIGGYRTDEDYQVRVSAEGEVTDISGGYHNYRQFMAGATPEKIAAAEAALREQLNAYGENHSGGYLTVDGEGWLCLSCEIIVYLDGPAEGEGGCGIDHDHVFINERICKPD